MFVKVNENLDLENWKIEPIFDIINNSKTDVPSSTN